MPFTAVSAGKTGETAAENELRKKEEKKKSFGRAGKRRLFRFMDFIKPVF